MLTGVVFTIVLWTCIIAAIYSLVKTVIDCLEIFKKIIQERVRK